MPGLVPGIHVFAALSTRHSGARVSANFDAQLRVRESIPASIRAARWIPGLALRAIPE
jgi:hypothetical protein